MQPRTRPIALAAALALGSTWFAACGGGGGDHGGKTAVARCPLGALRAAHKPVQITMWHQFAANNARVLGDITDRFNASQGAVRVKLVDNSAEGSSLPKYKAGLTTGDLPDLVQLEETTFQTMVDSRSTVPVQGCMDADRYAVGDFVPRALAYYTVGGALQSMPYNVSNPVLFYNKTAFAKAGLNPERPPATLADVRAYSERIVASGAAKHGIAFRMAPFLNEFWYSKAGALYADHGNGRDGRATKALLDTPMGRRLWGWLADMVHSGLALYTGTKEGDATHLFAIGTGDAAMTVEGSGVLGPIVKVLESGQYAGVKVGVGPLPDFRPGGGVQTAEGSLWIVRRSSPERQAAAWQFVKYLVSPEQLVALHLGTGYVPIRRSVAESPEVRALWARSPEYRVSYDQLVSGPTTKATTGAIIGAFPEVREAVRQGFEAMLVGGTSPAAALARAQDGADTAIQEYNSRAG